MEFKSDTAQHNVTEEVNIFLFDMPEEYSLGHCVAKDMRMSAGIAIYFKLLNNNFKDKISSVVNYFNLSNS